jgi:hypothetical protein
MLVVAWFAEWSALKTTRTTPPFSKTKLSLSYLDDMNVFHSQKRALVGLTVDSWQVGLKKQKEFLPVYNMARRLQQSSLACVETPMWEITQGPHYDALQNLFETYWIPDFMTKDNLLLQFDLVIIPDPVIAKYLVEAYFQKEAKLKKKRQYFDKLAKQPWGALDHFPPKERMEYERIKNAPKQTWIKKLPPYAVMGKKSYNRLKDYAAAEYFAYGVEDFALHLPDEVIPSRRVLVLRYKNRYDTLVQSLVMKNVNVSSAFPLTYAKKQWNPQEERIARDVDVVYFHEIHTVAEWHDRMGPNKQVVAACHDIKVATAAKEAGFADVFYAKKTNSDGLFQAVTKAVEFAKSPERMATIGRK